MLPAAFKTWFLFITLVISLTIFTKQADAAEHYPGTAITGANYKAPQNSNYALINFQNAIFCEVGGFSPIKQDCVAYTEGGGPRLFSQVPGGGALGSLSGVIIAMYSNPPTSSKVFLADLGSNIFPAQTVNAQDISGSGQGVIKPVLKLWQVSRNIAYLAFILVLVVIGFMIMFRQKINPQTVISVQSALPGIVVGLILTTFSYFIASLIIDLSFVGMKLVGFLFSESGVNNIITNPDAVATNSNIFGLFGSFVWNGQLFDFIPSVVKLFDGLATGLISGVISPTNVFDPKTLLLSMVTKPISLVSGGGVGLLVMLIMLIALLIQMFKLIWALVSSYISILVMTIAGPLIILSASIPGRGEILGVWWKGLLANVLVFPAVFAAFLFAGVFLGSVTPSDFEQTLPLFSGLPVEVFQLIIGYGIVLGTPAIPAMVKNAFGVKDVQGISQAAMGGAMAGFGAGRSGANKGWEATGIPGQNKERIAAANKYFGGVEGAKKPDALDTINTGTRTTGWAGRINRAKKWAINRGTGI